MTFAVIETGGKQYTVKEGDILSVELLGDVAEGSTYTFDKVLLVDDGTSTKVGTPYVAGATVTTTVLDPAEKGIKLYVVKYLQKSRYYKKNGHRQKHTKVRIEKIG